MLSNSDQLDERANVYFCVSGMRKGDDGRWRRSKDNFAGGLCLMIDDLGDGPGSRAPLSTIKALKPTALVETSPSNYQAIYLFDGLVTIDVYARRVVGWRVSSSMRTDFVLDALEPRVRHQIENLPHF